MNQSLFVPKNWKIVVFLMVTAMVMLACGSSPDPTATVSVPIERPVTEEPVIEEPVVEPTSTREPFSFGETDSTEAPTIETEEYDDDYPAYYTEEWDSDTDAWYTVAERNGGDSGKIDEVDIYTDGGRLMIELGKWLRGFVFYDPYIYEDVRLDMEVENRGANTNNVLLVCRYSDEGHYLVTISNGGLYSFYAYEASTDGYYRMANGGSTLIKIGKDTNTYTFICEDRDLTLGINGVEVRTYTDNKYVFRDGMVGIGVASEDVQPIKLEIEYVSISQP